MKVSKLGIVVLGLLLCGSVLAQRSDRREILETASHAAHTRQVHMTGTISTDGSTFVEALNQRVWSIKNIEALQGYDGQDVIVRGLAAPNLNVIQVISIKRQISYRANWGDSAFRR